MCTILDILKQTTKRWWNSNILSQCMQFRPSFLSQDKVNAVLHGTKRKIYTWNFANRALKVVLLHRQNFVFEGDLWKAAGKNSYAWQSFITIWQCSQSLWIVIGGTVWRGNVCQSWLPNFWGEQKTAAMHCSCAPASEVCWCPSTVNRFLRRLTQLQVASLTGLFPPAFIACSDTKP